MDKRELLKSKGWSTWYNENYWVHPQFASPSVDYTTRGMNTNEAYDFETDAKSREKTLKGMALYFGALNALSSLGHQQRTNNPGDKK